MNQVWLPGVDFLIGNGPKSTASCMHCGHTTEWMPRAWAVSNVVEHLTTAHQQNEPELRVPTQRGEASR